MKKNLSELNLNVKGVAQPYIRKIQGIDARSNMFTKKVQNIKHRPNQQTIEDQYVRGLQDQIKYLEMELKLLKEKQLNKHTQLDQLQKFFGDGIPINENILAIKNGFNNYKKTLESKIKEVQHEKVQREGLIQSLRVRNEEMTKEITQNQKAIRQFEKNQTIKYHQLLGEEARLKKQLQFTEQSLRNSKTGNRKLSQAISLYYRNKQIEMVVNLKNQNHKFTKLNKLKELSLQKDKELEELIDRYQDLRKQEDEKTYVINIEQDNLNLKKKIISMEKELNSSKTKIEQKKLELDLKLKERYKQITGKMEIKQRLDNQKAILQRENSLSVQEVEKYVKQKEILLLKKNIDKNKKLSQYVTYYGQLLSKVEDQIQSMAEKKPQLKNQLSVFTNDVNKLLKSIAQEQQNDSKYASSIIQAEAKLLYLNRNAPILANKIAKSKDQCGALNNECEILSHQLKVKDKQLELITILKSLSLEETEISKSTSGNIQTRLINFIRNWETLQKIN